MKSSEMNTVKPVMRSIAQITAFLLVSTPFTTFAEDAAQPSDNTIQISEEELAAESVLPVFDQPDSVKSRNVVTARRFELGFQGGYSLTEPFFNPLSLGATLSYHINEDHGLNVYYTTFIPGESDYSKQLNPIPRRAINANLQYAPAPKYIALGNYQLTAFYGKLSLSKEMVMNLGLYALAGGGMIGIGDVSKPVVNVGIGQKFYFDSQFALRFDLRVLAYRGPNAVSSPLDQKTTVQPASYFEEKMFVDTLLSFGAIYMLPQFF